MPGHRTSLDKPPRVTITSTIPPFGHHIRPLVRAWTMAMEKTPITPRLP